MKRNLLLFLLLWGCLSLFAQQRTYEYDYAGNRIRRSVVTLRSSLLQADSLFEKTEIEREGISKTLVTCEVAVYPNPTQGEVNITISNGGEDVVSDIAVYNSSGQMLLTLKAQGNTTVPVDLSSYVNGTYLINFQHGESKSYYKIVKY